MKLAKIKEIISLTAAVLALIFIAYLADAWTEPSLSPPQGNVAAPINVSTSTQTKMGSLILNTIGLSNGLIVEKGNVGIGTMTPGKKLEVVGGPINALGGLIMERRTNDPVYDPSEVGRIWLRTDL